ncbi:hypothetical protein AM228_20950 [Planktothricoides sp. SR001]|nr:hypothetical protein AM228_20950 [Planktothricoides sp. SR001]
MEIESDPLVDKLTSRGDRSPNRRENQIAFLRELTPIQHWNKGKPETSLNYQRLKSEKALKKSWGN